MNKPVPKKEIAIQSGGNHLQICAITQDAREWILKEGPRYGALFPNGKDNNWFSLYVNPNWDESEVAAYLESGGEGE